MSRSMTKRDVVRGCLLGVRVGDAAGATLEFFGRKSVGTDVERAMETVGGWPLRTAPGKITDDRELTLCLARALAGTMTFAIEKVALEYLAWLHSEPFEIGNATRNGLSGGFVAAPGKVHEGMWRTAAAKNADSKACGALMRATPLGGGDTGTNACNAGQMIAALHGEPGLTRHGRGGNGL